ncbi:MAG: hypothetical protein H7145_19545, partial [Akkermansiaceae bacterium]|nr:hypothetical protein [Armatimonadota bacterium]
MTLPFPLSITWRVRLLNGALSALTLIVLTVLAQARIHSVLYGAVDRTLTTQATDMINRPRHEFPEGRRGFPGPPDRRWDHPDPMGDPPEGARGREGMPGPERRRGPRPEPRPIRYGAISLMPTRHLPLDGRGGPEPWSVAGRDAVRTQRSDIRTQVLSDGMRLRVVSLRHDAGPGPGEIIQTAALLEPTDATLREIDSALYSLLLPLALVAAVIGAVLTEMALAP